MLHHENAHPTAPTRVVLLGGSGFIGRYLAARLRREGVPVVAPTSKEIDLSAGGAVGALRQLVEPSDAVVFLAAFTPDRGKGLDTFMTNLRVADHVCAALAAVGPRHVIYLSSDAVYRDNEAFVDERTATDSMTLYGSMHAVRERMLQHAIGVLVPLAVARPTLVFGHGDTHNSYGPNRFVRAALKDRRILLFGGGEERRDHIYVEDVAWLLAQMLWRRSRGAINLVTGRSWSFHDVADRIAQLVGSGVTIEAVPRVPGSISHRHFDPTVLLRAFPDVRLTSLEEGLARTLAASRVPA